MLCEPLDDGSERAPLVLLGEGNFDHVRLFSLPSQSSGFATLRIGRAVSATWRIN